MQLDRTRIAIRQRGMLETFDLALQIFREFAGPLSLCLLLGILPLALLNDALLARLLPDEFDREFSGGRFLWNMTLLIYLEAPLAGVFAVAFLGPAVFLEQRTVRQVVGDVFRYLPHLLLTHGLFRGLFVAWGLYLTLDPLEPDPVVEGFWMVLIVIWSSAARMFRPYINEIILLERNPLFSRQPGVITLGKRSSHLHGPYAGDLLMRWIGGSAIGLLLAALAVCSAAFLQYALVSDWWVRFASETGELVWNLDLIKLRVVYPACLWLVVGFLTVARFLSYLDLRIRHEGWEVELLMRAEALRLAAKVE